MQLSLLLMFIKSLLFPITFYSFFKLTLQIFGSLHIYSITVYADNRRHILQRNFCPLYHLPNFPWILNKHNYTSIYICFEITLSCQHNEKFSTECHQSLIALLITTHTGVHSLDMFLSLLLYSPRVHRDQISSQLFEIWFSPFLCCCKNAYNYCYILLLWDNCCLILHVKSYSFHHFYLLTPQTF